MAITILNSNHSFVRFDGAVIEPHCIWGDIDYCLPVFADSDINFQFVVQGTEAEIDALCDITGSEVSVGLVNECNSEPLLTFAEKPQRFRLSATQMLYNWGHGLPNFTSVIGIDGCFKVQITFGEVNFCSNCMQRISDDCFTSVIEYGNDEDAFGFKYCYGGDISEGGITIPTCDPTIVQFLNVPNLVVPYTTGLQAQYGPFPTVQVWIYDGLGQLVNMGITAAFDAYPPTTISFDFGGPSSGIIVIR